MYTITFWFQWHVSLPIHELSNLFGMFMHSGSCHKYYLKNKDLLTDNFTHISCHMSLKPTAGVLSTGTVARLCFDVAGMVSVGGRCQHELSNRGGCRSVPRVCCDCMTLGAPRMCVYIDWCSGCSFQRPNWVTPVVLLVACLTNLSFLSSNSPVKLTWHSLSYFIWCIFLIDGQNNLVSKARARVAPQCSRTPGSHVCFSAVCRKYKCVTVPHCKKFINTILLVVT